jgi:very-short-patch-repair endonuclease
VENVTEQERVTKLYEQLRLKLLDLSRKNPMLNYRLGARSKRYLQIVDEVLEDTYRKLVGQDAALKIAFLEPPDDIPPEERTEDFISELEHAKMSDVEYLTKLDELERAERDDEFALAAIERELRIKVRAQLGLPPRPTRNDINRADHARSLGIDPSLDLQGERSKPSHDDDSLQTLKYPDELESVMEKISSDARLAEQEMGVSTLFLAFGFLEWYEADDSDKKAYAPLLLLPVNVEGRKVRGKDIYYLSAREGAGEANLSLQKLLEERYNRELPDFVADEDETPASIEDYLDHTRTAIEGLKRWNIRRWLVLGHFAFGRFLMYIDLNPENWKAHPTQHSLVNSILTGSETGDDGSLGTPIPDDYQIDEPEVEKIAPLLIQDADASQHSALIDMMSEKNLVIQGPPGTGKSQTIANIIANAVYAGKRVLFLSEKQAALEVVKRRLDRAGLGDFCLELHSDKASPKSVIESLRARTDLGWGQPRRSPAESGDVTWFESRKAIGGYLAALHAELPDSHTPYTLIWKSLRGQTQDADVINAFEHVNFSASLLETTGKIKEVSGQMAVFADTASAFARNFGHPAQSPWADVPLADVPRYEVRRLISTLSELGTVAREVIKYKEKYGDLGIEAITDIERLIAIDNAIGDPPEDSLVATVASLDLDELEAGFAVKRELLLVEAAVASKHDFFDEDPDRLALAVALTCCGAPAAFLDQTPSEAYAIAADTIGRLSSLANIIEGCLPILQVLGLDRAYPSRGLDAVAISALTTSEIAPRHRSWVARLVDMDEITFEKAHSRWSDLAAADYEWRQKLRAYGRNPWPPATNIEAAAVALRKRFLAKAVASLTGSRRAARELALQLGFSDGVPTPEQLDELASHVRGLVEFESNQEIASVLGTAWQGVATPFDDIAGGIKSREFIRNRLVEFPEGNSIAIRMLGMTGNELAQLGELAPAGEEFRAIADELRGRLSDQPIAVLISELRSEITVLRNLLDIDGQRVLAGLSLSIREIAAVAELLSRRRLLVRTLSRCPLLHAVERLGRSIDEIDQAGNAIAWVRSVHGAGLAHCLGEALTSCTAGEVRGILREAAAKGAVLCQAFWSLVDKSEHEFGITGLQTLTPNGLVDRLELLLSHQTELGDFIGLSEQRQSLCAAGLSEMLVCADKLSLAPDRLPKLFETLVSQRRADQVRRQAPALCQNGPALEARRRAFAERDRIKIYGDRVAVRERLLDRRPFPGSNYGSRKTWTEMALLANEFGKQRRFTPVRDLLSRARGSIGVLKPCFMMSPLSLAKFLKPSEVGFDLLVIDEASQMRPEDALGGMLRAKQIVVVGDPKQLPPTDFFMRSIDETSSDDEFEDIDAESILEACQRTFRETRQLKWHYRSRCESLIAFSNREFYNNSLITFPTSRPGSFAVNLIRVDGAYQARRNVAEAICVAEKTVQFMRHFAEMDDATVPTLGLVAVNTDQRDLIQEELRRLCTSDQLVDSYRQKVETKGEPLFVKNLENVQGDERDYIFISLTYGREPGATAMKQRFGPINGKQGHRRLNVLFSRARMRIGLFASFGSADVKPSETSAEGVHVLKRYLEYAESRGRAVVETVGSEPDSDFEVEVAARLRARGYRIDAQVGVSGYKIDLGIRHPDHPEHFLAGVECDGARYHSSKSARDRDRLREEVLRGLGWEILRVWSTDWFDNPDLETEKLTKGLQQLQSQPRRPFEDYCLVHEVVPPLQKTSAEAPPAAVIADNPTVVGSGIDRIHFTVAPISEPVSVCETSLLMGDSPLTEEQGFKALKEFRETVIRRQIVLWEPHRSILRDGMIETFVRQHLTDPEDWFRKVPQYQRSSTNPVEKSLFLSQICEIIERIADSNAFTFTSPVSQSPLERQHVPAEAAVSSTRGTGGTQSEPATYAIADMATIGVTPRGDLFYEPRYHPFLCQMVTHVIEVEAPIYEDLLVTRIARAHGFQRSGNNIQTRVLAAIDRRLPRTHDDGREIFWREGMQTDAPVRYRSSSRDIRSHVDIPIIELAGLAGPFVRLRMKNEEILRRMAEQFDLGRLRDATRARFERAINLAKGAEESVRRAS